MILTFNRSYDIVNIKGPEHVEVLDDLKVHIASREVKNRWWLWGKHLEIDVSVTALNLDNNYCPVAERLKLAPLSIYFEAYNTRKNKRKLMEVAGDLSGKACARLFSRMPEKYNDESKFGGYTSKLSARLEEELIGLVEDNEPDGPGPC